jgi:hypothetical protein
MNVAWYATKNLVELAMQMVYTKKGEPFERGITCSDMSIDREASTSKCGGSSQAMGFELWVIL